jgi:hypothetical protein
VLPEGYIVERGLAARLSPHEETTLLRVRTAATLDDLNRFDVGRLALLELVSLDGNAVTLTPLGKQRIFLVGRQHHGEIQNR